MRSLNVAIAGLGRAGGQAEPVPVAGDGNMVVRNHTQALLTADSCRVMAFADTDEAARSSFSKANLGIDKSQIVVAIADLPNEHWDLIVLCTPTQRRLADVASVLAKRPRLLLLEKPLAANSEDGRAIIEACRDVGVQLRVNFNRRFDGVIASFRGNFPDPPKLFIGRYNNGLFNYASHMVDLLCHWYGSASDVRATGRAGPGADPVVSFVCRMWAGFEAHVVGVPGVDYDQFEMELHFTGSRAELINNGVEKRFFRARPNLYYPGYAHLLEDEKLRDMTPTGGFVEYYRALVHTFPAALRQSHGELSGCTGEEPWQIFSC